MSKKPRNVIVGPTTIRRVLNMSGLNSVCVEEPPPLISRKPMMIMARQHPIIMKLVRVNGIRNLRLGDITSSPAGLPIVLFSLFMICIFLVIHSFFDCNLRASFAYKVHVRHAEALI